MVNNPPLLHIICIFYHIFNGECSEELFDLMPASRFYHRTARHRQKAHPHIVEQWYSHTVRFKRSFLPNTCKMWNELPSAVFPSSYNMGFFKRAVNPYTIINGKPEDVNLMTWDWQQKFLDATINSNLIQKYPTSKQFRRLFLKKIIEYLEGNQEVHDDFYSHLCFSMSNGETDDSFCYRHYLVEKRSEVLTIKETNKMVVDGTTGMRTWEAALMVADWALCNKKLFTNRNILELGSGVGFTGITIGKLCQPRSIYLSDCHLDVIKAMCDNIKINFPLLEITKSCNNTTLFHNEGRKIGVTCLDWNYLEDLPNDIVPDVVIGADIVYDPSILQPLCKILKALFERNNQIDVYIASVIRNEETFQSFLKHLDNMSFAYQNLPLEKSVFIEWDHSMEKCLMKINCVFNVN